MSIYLEKRFSQTAEQLFYDFTHGERHAMLTGAEAQIEPELGSEFSAWDGYITGRNLALEAPKRILQAWRTSEFPESSPDSLLEIEFKEDALGTILCLRHTNLPEGQVESYHQGWNDHYFEPMLKHYGNK